MSYVVDIISHVRDDEFAKKWEVEVRQLCGFTGFCHAELFAKRQEIGEAGYDYLAAYCWSSEDFRREALERDFPGREIGGATVERVTCGLAVELSKFSPHAHGSAWLVNPFEISDEEIADVLDMWDKAKDHMVSRPGFVNARLLRADGAIERYGLVNLAQWESADQFLHALNDRAYEKHRERSRQYKLHPSLCERVACIEGVSTNAAEVAVRERAQ